MVSVYDLKSEARLKNHLVFLRTIGLANYVCGQIPEEDLLDMDMIVLSHEYSRESTFLRSVGVMDKPIPIEYPETLFFKQAPPVTVVGIIGECGKSTLVSMLSPLFDIACASDHGQRFFVIDPESSSGILAHLKKIRSGDIVIVRIIGSMLKELYSIRISPHVAVFPSIPSDESFSKSPFEILSYQTYNNFIVASDEIIDMTHSLQIQPKAKMLRTKISVIPASSGLSQRFHLHERNNLALALQTASLFRVDSDEASDTLLRWKPLKGRLEFIKKIKNVDFYNDSASISPLSTKAGIESLSKGKNIVLIMGGAKGDGFYGPLYESLPKYVHTIILLPGSGTILERRSIEKIKEVNTKSVPTIEEAVQIAYESSRKGDIVLFSPAFEAGGADVSRKERGERFVRAVRGL